MINPPVFELMNYDKLKYHTKIDVASRAGAGLGL